MGDSVLIYRPGTQNWIHDLKMDQIVEREGTNQWKAESYHFYFERIITAVEGNKVYFDNPVVMEMENKYGGGYLIKYSFIGRIQNCGIENLLMESTFQSETDEEHGWFATGARVCGPNVYTNCTSRNAQSDNGPHQRWAMGTLFDRIDTDGQFNVQDRGRMGSGHGWAGVTQVLWNCRSPKTAVQSPWVSGKNYCIGLIGGKYPGHFNDRND